MGCRRIEDWSHCRARYYDPHTAEFTSPDPLEYVDGMSLFRGYLQLAQIDPQGSLALIFDPKNVENEQMRGSLCIYDGGDLGDGNGVKEGSPRNGSSTTACGKDMRRTAELFRDKRSCAPLNLRKCQDCDFGDFWETDGPGCFKNVLLHEHGGGGKVDLGDMATLESQVDNICKSLCNDAKIFLVSCNSGTINPTTLASHGESTADLFLRLCDKVATVFGCVGYNYGSDCPGGIVSVVRPNTITPTGFTSWFDVMDPNDFECEIRRE